MSAYIITIKDVTASIERHFAGIPFSHNLMTCQGCGVKSYVIIDKIRQPTADFFCPVCGVLEPQDMKVPNIVNKVRETWKTK